MLSAECTAPLPLPPAQPTGQLTSVPLADFSLTVPLWWKYPGRRGEGTAGGGFPTLGSEGRATLDKPSHAALEHLD